MNFFSVRLPLSAARENLKRLVAIRAIALLAIMAGVYYAQQVMDAVLSPRIVVSLISVMLLMAILTVLRLRLAWPVTDIEYFVQLLSDVVLLTLLLYFTGGSTNPFISYYLVLLTVSAATLPWRYTWAIACATIVAYSVLVFYYHPLATPEGTVMPDIPHQGSFFSRHILGMWLTFVVSALLITYFVVKMAQAIREQDAVLSQRRESALHDEQLLAVATLAAGAAHELSTPLSTMAVVIGEMQHDRQEDLALQVELKILQGQVQNCKQTLQTLVRKSETNSGKASEIVAADRYIRNLLERWQLMRPEVVSYFSLEGKGASPEITVDETLSQAVVNLLNNAADASPEKVEVSLTWSRRRLLLAIRDFGGGIPLALADKMGKPFVTTKHKGLGLGLFLSHATAARFQGEVTLYNHDEGGTLTELSIPLQKAPGQTDGR